MIENEEQLRATHEALGHLYRALASLRQTVLPANPRQFAVFAEGPLEDIRKLQAEIDLYLGLKNPEPAEAFRESSPPYADGKNRE